MTLSLVVVFIPVLFMGGILGRLLHEFAVTISLAVMISGVVSLTLTPMLCSRFLRPPGTLSHGRLYSFFGAMLQGSLAGLRVEPQKDPGSPSGHPDPLRLDSRGYGISVHHRSQGVSSERRHHQIMGFTEADQGISFDSMQKQQKEIAAIISENPNVAAFMSSIGQAGPARLPTPDGSISA